MHKVMASLVEAEHDAQGKTVLYMPTEEIEDVQSTAQDMDVLQVRRSSQALYPPASPPTRVPFLRCIASHFCQCCATAEV
jgi:hypothetical protein